MSYQTIMDMANSHSLQQRMQAAAAKEAAAAEVELPGGVASWVLSNILTIVAVSGWDQKWEYYEVNYTPVFNPDVGARPDVVTDEDILGAVQPRILALVPDEPPAEPPA
jgi:hypothetical protein